MSRTEAMRRLLASAVTAALAVVALTACTGRSGGPADPCANIGPNEPREVAGPANVLLVDRSASTRALNGGTSVDPVQVLGTSIDAAAHDGSVVVGAFDGTGPIAWMEGELRLLDATSATAPVNGIERNKDNAQYRLNSIRDCVSERVKQAASGAAATPGSDVLGALDRAGAKLQQMVGSNGPRQGGIALSTDGLVNTGCVDLTHKLIGDRDEPARIVAACDHAGLLPRLDSINVTISGVGEPGQGHPRPSPAQREWLLDLWRQLCQATGANCTVEAGAQAAGTKAAPTGGAEDPPVRFPEVPATLPPAPVLLDEQLFKVDSALLAPGADQAFDKVVSQVRELLAVARAWDRPGATVRVRVEGHTDAQGDEAYNVRLSQARARKVVAELRRRGVTGLTAVGFGEARPKCLPQYLPDGRPHEENMRCNRRVEIVADIPAR